MLFKIYCVKFDVENKISKLLLRRYKKKRKNLNIRIRKRTSLSCVRRKRH